MDDTTNQTQKIIFPSLKNKNNVHPYELCKNKTNVLEKAQPDIKNLQISENGLLTSMMKIYDTSSLKEKIIGDYVVEDTRDRLDFDAIVKNTCQENLGTLLSSLSTDKLVDECFHTSHMQDDIIEDNANSTSFPYILDPLLSNITNMEEEDNHSGLISVAQTNQGTNTIPAVIINSPQNKNAEKKNIPTTNFKQNPKNEILNIIRVYPSSSLLEIKETGLTCPFKSCSKKLSKKDSLGNHIIQHVSVVLENSIGEILLTNEHRIGYRYLCNTDNVQGHDGNNNCKDGKSNGVSLQQRNRRVVFHCPVQDCKYYIRDGKGKSFNKMKPLKQHYRQVHSSKDIRCHTCHRNFAQESEFTAHKPYCGKTFRCRSPCSKEYTSLSALQTHARRQNHSCDIQKYKQDAAGTQTIKHRLSTHTQTSTKRRRITNVKQSAATTQTLNEMDVEVLPSDKIPPLIDLTEVEHSIKLNQILASAEGASFTLLEVDSEDDEDIPLIDLSQGEPDEHESSVNENITLIQSTITPSDTYLPLLSSSVLMVNDGNSLPTVCEETHNPILNDESSQETEMQTQTDDNYWDIVNQPNFFDFGWIDDSNTNLVTSETQTSKNQNQDQDKNMLDEYWKSLGSFQQSLNESSSPPHEIIPEIEDVLYNFPKSDGSIFIETVDSETQTLPNY